MIKIKHEIIYLSIIIGSILGLLFCCYCFNNIKHEALKSIYKQIELPIGITCYDISILNQDCYVSKDYKTQNRVGFEDNLLWFRCYGKQCILFGNYSYVGR
jgi:hypothetical protein